MEHSGTIIRRLIDELCQIRRSAFAWFGAVVVGVGAGLALNVLLAQVCAPQNNAERVLKASKAAALARIVGVAVGSRGEILIQLQAGEQREQTVLGEVSLPPGLSDYLTSFREAVRSDLARNWGGEEVAVLVVGDCADGRIVHIVRSRNREWLNATLVEHGRAYAARFPGAPEPSRYLFLRLQRRAQHAGRGMWQRMASSTFRDHFPYRS